MKYAEEGDLDALNWSSTYPIRKHFEETMSSFAEEFMPSELYRLYFERPGAFIVFAENAFQTGMKANLETVLVDSLYRKLEDKLVTVDTFLPLIDIAYLRSTSLYFRIGRGFSEEEAPVRFELKWTTSKRKKTFNDLRISAIMRFDDFEEYGIGVKRLFEANEVSLRNWIDLSDYGRILPFPDYKVFCLELIKDFHKEAQISAQEAEELRQIVEDFYVGEDE